MSRKEREFIPPDAKAGDIRGFSMSEGRLWLAVHLYGHDFDYQIRTAEIDGVSHVVELLIRPSDEDIPITPQDLRRIPLKRLAAATALFGHGGEFEWERMNRPEKPVPSKPGPRGYGDEHYGEVAQLARDAVRMSMSARQYISRSKHVTVHTADKWLKECRKRGHLTAGELRRNRKDTQQ
ncbi:hypothetical protein ACQP0C_02505 [Nocardia sp. CA-129566]|uniref:hypothetical protein n=1 Tax=Nocardia sp. CA-129566 TaxID=3239976 RepID=UPI003D98EF6D